MTLFQRIREKSTPLTKKIIYISAAGLTTLFGILLLFVPFCLFEKVNDPNLAALTPIGCFALFQDDATVKNGLCYLGLAVFLLCLVYIIVTIVMLLKMIVRFQGDDKILQKRTQALCMMNTIATGIYTFGSVIFYYVNTAIGGEVFLASNAFPFILALIIDALFALYLGIIKEGFLDEEIRPKSPAHKQLTKKKIELFLFTTALVICAVLCCCLTIIRVEFVGELEKFSKYNFSMRGVDLFKNFAALEEGSQILTFVLFFALTVVGSFYFLSLISFLSKSNSFFRFAMGSIIATTIGCFLVGMYGKYYQILQAVNTETIVSWVEQNVSQEGIEQIKNIQQDFLTNCKVSSSSFTFFLVSFAIVGVLLARRPYSKGLALVKELYPDANGMTAHITKAEFSLSDVENLGERVHTPAVSNSNEAFSQPNQPVLFADPCPAFTEIDRQIEAEKNQLETRKEESFEAPTLRKIVEFIVQYARDSRLHLFYTEEDIATFIAGLGATKLTILQGMSGTGKTSLPKIFSEALSSNCNIVEVESSWRDKNELLGYYNEFSKTYTPKKFTQALYYAGLHPETLTFIVLDEMNLSRIEYYFSDFLSLMENEPNKREIKLLNVPLYQTVAGEKQPYRGLCNGHTVKIPPNVWFIGTANRDESTFEISDKVYDRAHTMNFNKRAKKVNGYNQPVPQKFLAADTFNRLLEEAISTSTFTVDGYPLIAEVEQLLAPYNISFGNRIAMQMERFVAVYCACFSSSEEVVREGVERILLSKVVSKLELKSVENKEELAKAFEELGLRKCSAFISKLNED